MKKKRQLCNWVASVSAYSNIVVGCQMLFTHMRTQPCFDIERQAWVRFCIYNIVVIFWIGFSNFHSWTKLSNIYKHF